MENLTSKKIVDRKKELTFIIATALILLTLLLISFFALRFLYKEAEELFSRDTETQLSPIQFNFDLYRQLFNPGLAPEESVPATSSLQNATSSSDQSAPTSAIDAESLGR